MEEKKSPQINTDLIIRVRGREKSEPNPEEISLQQKRLQEAIAFAMANPGVLSEIEIMERFGLADKPSISNNTQQIRERPTVTFSGQTSGSGLLMNPEVQKENAQKERRRKEARILFEKIERMISSFLNTNNTEIISNTLSELLIAVQKFIDLQPEFPDLIDHGKSALNLERFLLTQADFLKLKTLMIELQKGNNENEKEIRRILGECQGSEMHPAFKNELKVFGEFLAFLDEARDVDFEMESVLKQLHNFVEKKDIFNIPDDLLVAFRKVLVRFYNIRAKKFPFDFKTPIKVETIKKQRAYCFSFREMLFGDFDRDIPVNEQQRALLQKKLDKMTLFASIEPYNTDEKVMQGLIEFRAFIEEYDKKLNAIIEEQNSNKIKAGLILEKIIILGRKFERTPNSEKVVRFSIKTVFSCEKSKAELGRKLMEAGMGEHVYITQEKDLNRITESIYKMLGWL